MSWAAIQWGPHSLHPQHLQHCTAAWPLDFNLLSCRTDKWWHLLARTHPTWSSFGEVSDSKSRPGAVDCAIALKVTESILSGFMWGERAGYSSHFRWFSPTYGLQASNSKKDPRNLHYNCKMWPLRSTASKKPSKLLTLGTCRKISTAGTSHIKNMEMTGQSQGSASGPQLPVTYIWQIPQEERDYSDPQFQEMEAIFTARHSEGSAIYSAGNLWHGLWPQRELD